MLCEVWKQFLIFPRVLDIRFIILDLKFVFPTSLWPKEMKLHKAFLKLAQYWAKMRWYARNTAVKWKMNCLSVDVFLKWIFPETYLNKAVLSE